MLLNETIKLRIKSSDKEKIREVAKLLDMNMSTFLYKCAMDKIEEILKEKQIQK